MTRTSSRLLVLLLLAAGLATALPAGAERAGSGLLPDAGRRARLRAGLTACGLLEAGGIRCWGNGDDGRLGYNSTDDIGDTEHPDSVGPVQLGAHRHRHRRRPLAHLRAAHRRPSALLGQRCGAASLATTPLTTSATPSTPTRSGRSNSAPPPPPSPPAACTPARCSPAARCAAGAPPATGNSATTPPPTSATPSTPDSVGPVQLGATATAITAGTNHTCALLTGGQVRCWGSGSGSGSLATTHADQHRRYRAPRLGRWLGPSSAAPLPPSPPGLPHLRAALPPARCAAGAPAATVAGYNSTASIGDTEHPDSVGPVQLGGTAIAISRRRLPHLRAAHHRPGALLGLPAATGSSATTPPTSIGDTEHPDSARAGPNSAAPLPPSAGGGNHTCALLTTGQVRCWGSGNSGQLGYNSTASIGDTESTSTPLVPVAARRPR